MRIQRRPWIDVFVTFFCVMFVATIAVAQCDDADADGICDTSDNCPTAYNPDQSDVHALTTGPPFDGRDVIGYEIAGDPAHPTVVYIADEDHDDVFELYSTPLAGPARVRLNAPLVENGDVHTFQVAPDGGQVVYLADQEQDGVNALYLVRIDGGSATRLSPVGKTIDSNRFEISADSSRVVFESGQDLIEVWLDEPSFWSYIVEWNGDSYLSGWTMAPDRRSVVYGRAIEQGDNMELWTASVAPGGKSGFLYSPAWTGSGSFPFAISPDSSYVVFDVEDYGLPPETRSVALGGGSTTLLIPDTTPHSFWTVRFTPDGSRIVIQGSGFQLLSVSVAGGPLTPITPTLPASPGFRVSNAHVAYTAAIDDPAQTDLYRTSVTSESPVKVNPTVQPGLGGITDFDFSADGSRLLFLGEIDVADRSDLHTTPAASISPTRITPLTAESSVESFVLVESSVVFSSSGPIDLQTSSDSGGVVSPISVIGEDAGDQVRRTLLGHVYRTEVQGADFEIAVTLFTADGDGDTVDDLCDNCALDPNPAQDDFDGDGQGDECDPCPLSAVDDLDRDGLCGDVDNCPTTSNAGQEDDDSDGVGDACDFCPGLPDVDLDGLCDTDDNCPGTYNPAQDDTDADGSGDACDICPFDALDDADGDGVCGNVDNCPSSTNADQIDSDEDGAGDVCDPCPSDPLDDVDEDAVCGDADNCPTVANPGQEDDDADGLGDVCDPCPFASSPDPDDDGVCGDLDNCPLIFNDTQLDTDGDGQGDVCDPCPEDPVIDGDDVCSDVDNCMVDENPAQGDSDGDGPGDACDSCPSEVNPQQDSVVARTKLNPTYTVSEDIVYEGFAASPDLQWVVYMADQETPGREELFSVSILGGPTTKLNVDSTTDVYSFRIGPDSNLVGFRQGGNLKVVPIGGGPVVDLAGSVRDDFLFTPDGDRIVYRSYAAIWEELYSVDVAGNPPVKLSQTLVAGGAVTEFDVISDGVGGARVVFKADATLDNRWELFQVSATGGPVTQLSDPLQVDDVSDQRLYTPDDAVLVYTATSLESGVTEVFRVPTAGGATLRLSQPLGQNVGTVLLTPDGTEVIYRGFPDGGLWDVFVVPIDGGPRRALGFWARLFRIAPDGRTIVFLHPWETPGVSELFRTSIDGDPITRLSGPMTPGGQVYPSLSQFDISSDGAWVAYIADQETDEVMELFAVPLSGGPAIKVSGPMVENGDLGDFRFSPSGALIVYWADQETNNSHEFYATRPGGSASVRLNAELPVGSATNDWQVVSDTAMLYRMRQDSSRYELFVTHLEADTDGDGVLSYCDCAPDDDGAFSAPGEVQDVRFESKVRLAWSSASIEAGAATVHAVMRGNVDGLPVGGDAGETCLETALTDSVLEDLVEPAQGSAFYYLVRATNVCDTGIWGATTAAGDRVSPICD